MAFIPATDVALAEIVLLVQGQRVENTLYFENRASTLLESQQHALAAGLLDWWDSELSGTVSTSAHIVEISVTNLTSATSTVVTLVPSGGQGNGGSVAEPMPNGTTFCVSFRTLGRGRSARGRNYTVGMTKESTVGNLVTAAYAQKVVDSYNLLLTLAETLDLTWVVLSRYENKLPRVAGLTWPIQTAIYTDLAVDSQRRRLTGRGN